MACHWVVSGVNDLIKPPGKPVLRSVVALQLHIGGCSSSSPTISHFLRGNGNIKSGTTGETVAKKANTRTYYSKAYIKISTEA